MGDEWTIYGIEKVMDLSMVWSRSRLQDYKTTRRICMHKGPSLARVWLIS